MFWILLGLMFFRWPLLHRHLGTVKMFLFDAIMYTVIGAMNFANPGTSGWLSYAVGGVCVYFAISSGRKYLKYDELQRIENGKGKSDTGAAKGS